MYIIGVILLFILPLAAGTVCKGILRWKETNQIETYLIGFFFLFFLQGVVLVPAVMIGMSFSLACNLMLGIAALIAVLFVIMAVWNKVRVRKGWEEISEKKKVLAKK